MIDEKIDKIVELDISDDELDDELFEEMGVDIISLVDQPAIQTDFLYFNEEDYSFRKNSECPDGFEHKMPDGNWMCGKEHSSYSEEEKLAIVEFAENDENGIYITKDDLYMDMTLNSKLIYM